MHDLNTINRLNFEAFAESIQKYRREGRFVLARYDGLVLTSIETFSELTAAQLIADTVKPLAGERVVIFAPTAPQRTPALPTMRDQSEDRAQPFSIAQLDQLARFGQKPQHTLGDYLAAKSNLLNSET